MNEIINLLKDLPVGGIGFAGLVTLAIILIFKGEIVPKSTLEMLKNNWETINTQKTKENDMLKEAYRLSEEARQTDAEAIPELLELGRTTVHLLQSIHDRASEVDNELVS